MATTATAPDLLGKVESLASTIQQHAMESEQERRLSRPIVDAMIAAGLFRMCRPKVLGGLEVDAPTALRVCEEVSRLDTSAGWNLQISNAGYSFGAWLPPEGGLELGGDAEVVLAGGVNPPGRAIPVDGGYRVTGRWPFASNCHHANWLLGSALIFDGDEPRKGSHGAPVLLLVTFPASDAAILDTWHTMGLRGTGSHDIAVTDLFVPQRRAGAWLPVTTFPQAYSGPLYRLTVWFPIAALATPALGTARAAIDSLIELSARKTPAYLRSTLAGRASVQGQVGEAEALLGAARAYFYETMRDAWDTVCESRPLTTSQKVAIQLAASHAVKSAVEIVTLVHEATGTSGIREEQRFERYFRDVHTLSQHAFGSALRFQSAGKMLLGQESDWPFFEL